MKLWKILILILLVAGIASQRAFAGNPADLTDSYRFYEGQFYKLTYDGGPKWAWATLPIDKDVSVSFYNWEDKEGTDRLFQLIVAKRFTPWLDVAFSNEGEWVNKEFTTRQKIAVDLHNKNLGMGIIIPMQPEEEIQVSPRIKINDFVAYATFSEDSDPLYGLSYCKKGMRIDVACGKGVTFVRASKCFETKWGTIIPELRTKFTDKENFYGLGIGFCPR